MEPDPETHRQELPIAPAKREPIFNVPAVVVVVIAGLVAIHATLVWLLGTEDRLLVTYLMAFHPWIFGAPVGDLYMPAMRYWTPVSYALLHGDWTHLGINCAYLLAFGTPVARRFGVVRFCLLMVAGAIGGALAHWLSNVGSNVPMIGASAAVSAAMGAAIRFALAPGVPTAATVHRPALSLGASLANRGILTFVVVWFALNWLFGSGVLSVPGQDAGIAWQAHIGGFLIGWLGFGLLDPVKPDRRFR